MSDRPAWKAMTFGMIKREAEENGIETRWAVERRVEFLKRQISDAHKHIGELKLNRLGDLNEVSDEFLTAQIEAGEYIKAKAGNEITRLTEALAGIRRPGAITDEMIEDARDYPVEELVDFSRGRAFAFCHDSDTRSMSHHKEANRVHCFVCNESFNPIDILTVRDGVTFSDAVKTLSGGS